MAVRPARSRPSPLFLLREMGLNVVVKLNPTLFGREALREILHDRLGYTELQVPDAAFDNDPKWEQIVAIVERLGRPGLGAGPWLRREVQQHAAGQEPQGLLSGNRSADVHVGVAAARPGHGPGPTFPLGLRRPLPGLVFGGNRRGQFRRCRGARPEAGHRLLGPAEGRRLRPGHPLPEGAGSAHGCGRGSHHRRIHRPGLRPR